MSRREDIDNGFWSDPDILALSPTARSVFLWSWTNQRCGMAGLYKVARPAMQLETGWDSDTLDAALAELAEHRFAFYDGRVMWVRARVKRLRTKSPSIAKSILTDLESVGVGHPFVARFLDQYADSWLWKHVPRPQYAPVGTPSAPPADPQEAPVSPSVDPPEGSQGKGNGKGTGKGMEEPTEAPVAPARASRAAVDHDSLPDDFPVELAPAVDETLRMLERVASAKGAIAVARAGVARTIAARPRKPHAKAAADFETYWLDGPGQGRGMRDVVASFRNWLDREPDMAAAGHRPTPSDDRARRARRGAAMQDLMTPATGGVT
jgi:hypothetical protein